MKKRTTLTRLTIGFLTLLFFASASFPALAQPNTGPDEPASEAVPAAQTPSETADTTIAPTTVALCTGGAALCAAAAIWNYGNDIGNCVSRPISCAVDTVGWIMLSFSTYLLAIAGVLLNLVVMKLVFQFAEVIGNSPGLLLAWRILRDLGNMALLFGFIFIGVATVLGIAKYSYRKALPALIIVAIAMNFSLFVAEAVIDTSNAFAAVMYTQASANSCPQSEEVLQARGSTNPNDPNAAENALNDLIRSDNCLLNYGIAGSLMQATGLAGMLDLDWGVGRGSIVVYMGLALFALIGAIVLFAAAIMLMMRAVILTFVMITAPLGFAAMAIPPLQPQAKKWWDYLLKQSFFAPILILFILISIKVTNSFSAQDGQITLAGALTQPNSSTMGIILVFTLVIGFLIASLMAAKSFGAVGANFAVKTAGTVGFGLTGWAGRNTAGRASAGVARRVRTSRLGTTETGRRIAGAFDRGAGASFDMRGTKAFKNASKSAKLDFGAPSKKASGGMTAAWKAQDEARKKYGASIPLSRKEEERKERLENERKEIVEESKERKKEIEERRKKQKKGESEVAAMDQKIAALEQRLGQNANLQPQSVNQGSSVPQNNAPAMPPQPQAPAPTTQDLNEGTSAPQQVGINQAPAGANTPQQTAGMPQGISQGPVRADISQPMPLLSPEITGISGATGTSQRQQPPIIIRPGSTQDIEQKIAAAQQESTDRLRQGDREGATEALRRAEALRDQNTEMINRVRFDIQELDQLRKARKEKAESIAEEKRVTDEFEAIEEAWQTRKSDIKKEIDGINPQEEYAAHIEKGGMFRGDMRRRKATADGIRKKIKGGSEQKLKEYVEAVKKEDKEKKKDKEDSDEEDTDDKKEEKE